jgi:hypothetical protein
MGITRVDLEPRADGYLRGQIWNRPEEDLRGQFLMLRLVCTSVNPAKIGAPSEFIGGYNYFWEEYDPRAAIDGRFFFWLGDSIQRNIQYFPPTITPPMGTILGGNDNLGTFGYPTAGEAADARTNGWLGYASSLIDGRSIVVELSFPLAEIKAAVKETGLNYIYAGVSFSAGYNTLLTASDRDALTGSISIQTTRRRPNKNSLEIGSDLVTPYLKNPAEQSTAIFTRSVAKRLGWVDNKQLAILLSTFVDNTTISDYNLYDLTFRLRASDLFPERILTPAASHSPGIVIFSQPPLKR